MRHFDAWLLRDPYSIFHYYSTGRRWQETVRDLIQERKICAPSVDLSSNASSKPVDPYARPMASQSNSLLFRKLPAEIRLMIYNYAFGDEAVHLVQLKDKIRHVRCKNLSSSLDRNRSCCPVTPARWRAQENRMPGHSDSMLYPHTHTSLPEFLSNSSVALLRTCRAIYAEAADILYSHAVFDVDDLHTFIAFSLTVCPDRLRAIKRLTVQWMPIWQPMAGQEHKSSIYSHTHNDRLWALFWTRIAALRGLEQLHLSLDLGRFSGNANGGILGSKRFRLAVDESWVSPMLCVRGLKSFELGITARCDAYAKRVMEQDLCRDAVALRDALREIMCSPHGQIPIIPTLQTRMACGLEEEVHDVLERKTRPRLAITAA
ncbi:hypothetical protein ETB97_009152 [Aspergillus alliaceus]|uniref:DUF7730 domain-containing protein n=1 Tax=Petromyces alliaceus TaxID=209559 RepID=A0A5N6FJF4_PETAA|nr:uncharacterized protein BDW43DRAFT_192087 [Aspergillus alliaceus]KAB8229315.1 hypothetical protein BDW43DRAFT_192087 [Aspergillus alliaceus]KAF5863866.1 hypothetical protein ETB97_009152 [Aspergillus burnettii]